MRHQSLMALFLSLSCVGTAQSNAPRGWNFPKHFCPDCENEGFVSAKPPSDRVLDALLKTEEAKESAAELEGLDREKRRLLFRVVPVRLSSQDEEDYLAIGSGPLTGADCYWFWIVRIQHANAKAVLFTNGLRVDIMNRSTKGYKDIRSEWRTGSFTGECRYEFNGSRYVLVSDKSEAVKP